MMKNVMMKGVIIQNLGDLESFFLRFTGPRSPLVGGVAGSLVPRSDSGLWRMEIP